MSMMRSHYIEYLYSEHIILNTYTIRAPLYIANLLKCTLAGGLRGMEDPPGKSPSPGKFLKFNISKTHF